MPTAAWYTASPIRRLMRRGVPALSPKQPRAARPWMAWWGPFRRGFGLLMLMPDRGPPGPLMTHDAGSVGVTPDLRADSGSLDSGIRSYLGQASEHDADHGEADEGNDGGGVSLEVASEPAIASDPGKGALDDPSLGQDDELVGFTPFDDFKLPSPGIGNDLCDPWPLIGGISAELGD